jgi:hypothetical protein
MVNMMMANQVKHNLRHVTVQASQHQLLPLPPVLLLLHGTCASGPSQGNA